MAWFLSFIREVTFQPGFPSWNPGSLESTSHCPVLEGFSSATRGRSEPIGHPMFHLSEGGLEAEVSQHGRQVSHIVEYIEPVRLIVESVHHQIGAEYSATCLLPVTLRFQ